MDSCISGFLSGISQTIFGYPFDTWKTRRQASQVLSIRVFPQIAFRGMSVPLLFNGFYQSFLFTHTSFLQTNCYSSWYISGALSGSIGSLFTIPIESWKITRQCIKPQIKIPWRFVCISTILRDSIGSSIYFGSYHRLKNTNQSILFIGGISGWMSWFFTYPLDTYKTRFQLAQAHSWKQVFYQGNPFAGFSVFSIRCFIVNAISWFVYESVHKIIVK